MAILRYLEDALGRECGGPTDTIFCAMLSATEMRARGQAGSIVGIMCDGGERYLTATTTTSGWLKAASTLARAPRTFGHLH